MIEQQRPGGTSSLSLRDNQLPGTNPQLSSPISPPRSLRPLANMTQASFPVSSKRLNEDDENAYANADASLYNSQDILLDTPRQQHRPTKRLKPADEPITPKSVERRTLSQLSQLPPEEEAKQLPTLTELMANSKRRRKSSSIRSSQTPRQDMLGFTEMTFSPIPYSMFKPQAQSTQVRAFSLEHDDIVSSAVP